MLSYSRPGDPTAIETPPNSRALDRHIEIVRLVVPAHRASTHARATVPLLARPTLSSHGLRREREKIGCLSHANVPAQPNPCVVHSRIGPPDVVGQLARRLRCDALDIDEHKRNEQIHRTAP